MKLMRVITLLVLIFCVLPTHAQKTFDGPIIDMHMHGPLAESWGPPIEEWLVKIEQLDVRKVALAAYPEQLAEWVPKASDKLIPSLMFPCLVQAIEMCFPDDADWPDVDWVRAELEASRIQMFGEVITELYGVFPSDKILEP